VPSSSLTFSSFGEYASKVLGIRRPLSTTHVAWVLKTPIAATVPSDLAAMTYRFVDPAPFMPTWGQRVMVPGRPTMHSVVTGRLQRKNNDVAIAFLHPLPPKQTDFDNIRDTLVQFLNVQMNMSYQSIQPCPFGQSYVTFSHISHRDFLINSGPYQIGDTHISFIPHDRAWNNRTTFYTHEVWLMMIGLNLDLWTYSLVQKVVSKFGKLMIWEEDHNHQARSLVKVRVTSLDVVPCFFNFSEGEEPESDSWTIQCEIILTRMLGAQPQAEDCPPDDLDDVNPHNFEFFSFGQPDQGLAPPNGPNQPNAHFIADLGNQVWAPWDPNAGQNAAQQLGNHFGLGQPAQNQPIVDEAPLLIPLQPVAIDVPENVAMSVEEVIQNNQGIEDFPPIPKEQVLVMDDFIDTDSEGFPQAQLPIPLVEIEPFLDSNNLQPLLPEEIQEANLLGEMSLFGFSN
jgi:hypothetical protein